MFKRSEVLCLCLIFCSTQYQMSSQNETIEAAIEKNFSLKKTVINSDSNEFGGVLVGDELYFSSNKKARHGVQLRNKKTNSLFYDLYKISYDVTSKKVLKKSFLLRGDVNTKMNESSPFITKDRKTMYYTANGSKKSKNLRILKAFKEDDKWKSIEDLSINAESYSNAHSVLNSTETILYFTSNRAGGFGKSDIYSVVILEDGSLGVPKNLGPEINSKENEVHPFITANDELYFSSTRDSGRGGLDVFYVNLKDPNTTVYNLGAMINTEFDDFSFWMDDHINTGFVSSNATGGLHMYQVSQVKPIREIIKNNRNLKVKLDSLDYKNLTLAFEEDSFNLSDAGKQSLDSIINRVSLDSTIVLDLNSIIERKGVTAKVYNQRIKTVMDYIKERIRYNFEYLSEGEATEMVENGLKGFSYPIIYFDKNSSYLLKEDKKLLADLILQLKKDKELKLHIKSRADSRGTIAYNAYMAEKRFHRIKDYLIHEGVSSDRITGAALGEKEIINKCRDAVDCNEIEHRANRKIDFKFFK